MDTSSIDGPCLLAAPPRRVQLGQVGPSFDRTDFVDIIFARVHQIVLIARTVVLKSALATVGTRFAKTFYKSCES